MNRRGFFGAVTGMIASLFGVRKPAPAEPRLRFKRVKIVWTDRLGLETTNPIYSITWNKATVFSPKVLPFFPEDNNVDPGTSRVD